MLRILTLILTFVSLLAPSIQAAEANGILIITGVDSTHTTQLVTPYGTCSASNPTVKSPSGAMLAQYITTPKGGSISAYVGYGAFKITAPSTVGWGITNCSLAQVRFNGGAFRFSATATGSGNYSWTLDEP